MLPENFFLRAPVGILARANLKCEGAKLEIQSATQNHPIFMPFLDFKIKQILQFFQKFHYFLVKLVILVHFFISATNIWERRAPSHNFWAPLLSLRAPKWRRSATSGSTALNLFWAEKEERHQLTFFLAFSFRQMAHQKIHHVKYFLALIPMKTIELIIWFSKEK